MTRLTARAPAKVNLSLHVGPPKPNGRHDLVSLVAFADTNAADEIIAEPATTFSLAVEGPFASQAGPAKDNLVLKAARLMNDALDGQAPPLAFKLKKLLPAAAGIGGGSADAAAALRLIAKTVGDPAAMITAAEVAPLVGSDVLACLESRPGLMHGEGDQFEPLGIFPDVPALLVNPGLPCPTADVYAAYDEEAIAPLGHPPIELRRQTAKALIRFLSKETRNDLSRAAEILQPEIATVLKELARLPGARLARMSGSGSTCFALFETPEAAQKAASKYARIRPKAWVVPTLLGTGIQAVPLAV